MTAVFEAAARDASDRGPLAYGGFLLSEFVGLVAGALQEQACAPRSSPRPPIALLLGGAAISVIVMRFFLFTAGSLPAARLVVSGQEEVLILIALASVSFVLIAAFALAFVLNLRILMRRSERRFHA
jgi:hypothetical protein